jgi:DNA-binding PadR family transcriptional regulator
MSVRNSLLAILTQGACYGYQLRQEFDRRTGATWPLNVGQVYTTLDRLERDGLVSQSGTDVDGRVMYAISEAGRIEAARWLVEPVARTASERDELAVKLAIAVTLPGVDAAAIIAAQRILTEGTIRAARAQRAAAESSGTAAELVLDARIGAAQAELAWLDRTAARITRGDAISAPFGLLESSPKRGRPAKVVSA